MTKKLIEQALYDQACEALSLLGLTPAKFCVMTRAMDIVETFADPENFAGEPSLDDLMNLWEDSLNDDWESELKEAWGMLV